MVLIILVFLVLFALLNFKSVKIFELNNPSEVFSFSFYFLLSFIAFKSILLLASGVVDTIDVAILESTSGITTTNFNP